MSIRTTREIAKKPPKAGVRPDRAALKEPRPLSPKQRELLLHLQEYRGKYSPRITVDGFLRKAEELGLAPNTKLYQLTEPELAIFKKRRGL